MPHVGSFSDLEEASWHVPALGRPVWEHGGGSRIRQQQEGQPLARKWSIGGRCSQQMTSQRDIGHRKDLSFRTHDPSTGLRNLYGRIYQGNKESLILLTDICWITQAENVTVGCHSWQFGGESIFTPGDEYNLDETNNTGKQTYPNRTQNFVT